MANTTWQVTGDYLNRAAATIFVSVRDGATDRSRHQRSPRLRPRLPAWIAAGMARCPSTISVSSSWDTPRKRMDKEQLEGRPHHRRARDTPATGGARRDGSGQAGGPMARPGASHRHLPRRRGEADPFREKGDGARSVAVPGVLDEAIAGRRQRRQSGRAAPTSTTRSILPIARLALAKSGAQPSASVRHQLGR